MVSVLPGFVCSAVDNVVGVLDLVEVEEASCETDEVDAAVDEEEIFDEVTDTLENDDADVATEVLAVTFVGFTDDNVVNGLDFVIDCVAFEDDSVVSSFDFVSTVFVSAGYTVVHDVYAVDGIGTESERYDKERLVDEPN